MCFSGSAHEGLVIDYDSCKYIIGFLEKNKDLKKNSFNFNACLEEMVLQTILCNYNGYFYIGNGVNTINEKDIKNLPQNKFVYKTIRK